MALRHYTITIPTPAAVVRCSSALPDGKAHREGGQYDTAVIFASFELQSGTGGFVGDENVTATNYAAKITATKTYEPHGGTMRLGDIYVTGTAGDKIQIGVVDL